MYFWPYITIKYKFIHTLWKTLNVINFITHEKICGKVDFVEKVRKYVHFPVENYCGKDNLCNIHCFSTVFLVKYM